jgi:putative membrane protein
MTHESEWLSSAARERVERAVIAAEKQTAAELVVTVRRVSGNYRDADFAFGACVAFAALLVYVYHPITFTDDLVPPAIALLFVASAFFCSQVGWLRRVFVRRRRRKEATRVAALAAFVEQGIGATRGRTGLLVYISLFERQLEVVHDIGIRPSQLGASWNQARQALEEALQSGQVEAVAAQIEALGPVLSRVLPRTHDDVNELPDQVVG